MSAKPETFWAVEYLKKDGKPYKKRCSAVYIYPSRKDAEKYSQLDCAAGEPSRVIALREVTE